MANNVKKAHIRAIRKLFREIKNSLDDLEYWTKENETGVAELVTKDIQNNYSEVKMHMQYLSSKFN